MSVVVPGANTAIAGCLRGEQTAHARAQSWFQGNFRTPLAASPPGIGGGVHVRAELESHFHVAMRVALPLKGH